MGEQKHHQLVSWNILCVYLRIFFIPSVGLPSLIDSLPLPFSPNSEPFLTNFCLNKRMRTILLINQIHTLPRPDLKFSQGFTESQNTLPSHPTLWDHPRVPSGYSACPTSLEPILDFQSLICAPQALSHMCFLLSWTNNPKSKLPTASFSCKALIQIT